MNLQSAHSAVNLPNGRLVQARYPDAMEDVVLRHLTTPAQIEGILHLREGIDLSAHTGADSFRELEKKETNAVLSSGSN